MKHLQELGLDTSDASIYIGQECRMEAVLTTNQKVYGFLSLHKEFQTLWVYVV